MGAGEEGRLLQCHAQCVRVGSSVDRLVTSTLAFVS